MGQSPHFRQFRRGRLRGKHRSRAKIGFFGCTCLHGKARPIPCLHLQLRQDPPPGARGGRPRVPLPGFSAYDPRNDQDPGAQRTHRENSRAGPVDSPACKTGIPAAIGVARVIPAKARFAFVPESAHAPWAAEHPNPMELSTQADRAWSAEPARA